MLNNKPKVIPFHSASNILKCEVQNTNYEMYYNKKIKIKEEEKEIFINKGRV